MIDSRPAQFFESLKTLYSKSSAQGQHVLQLQLAEIFVAVNFSSREMLECMLPSVAHIVSDETHPADLTIYSFDGPRNASFPWGINDFGAQGAIEGYNTGRFQAAYQHVGGAVMVYDRETKEGIYWIENYADIPYWERSFPFRTIIHWWSRDTSYLLLHAAGIGLESTAALLSGKSGSGKSSTTLSCLLQDDLRIAGDDYVLVDSDNGMLYSIYNCAKVEWDNLGRLGFLKALVDTTIKNAEKAMIFMQNTCPEKIVRKSQLHFAFVPVVCNAGKTRIVACSDAEVLRSIAPTTMFQLPYGQAETFRKCSALAKKLRPFRVELGTDAREIAGEISSFLNNTRSV